MSAKFISARRARSWNDRSASFSSFDFSVSLVCVEEGVGFDFLSVRMLPVLLGPMVFV